MTERLRYPELAPEGMAHLRGLEHYLNASTALPAVLLELVRLRASLLNGCSFCVGHHTRELEKHNEPVTRSEALRDWQRSDAFTPRERAALAWTDVLTNIQSNHASDEEYEAVSEFFEGKELVDLSLTIAAINAWNRMSIAFGARWDPSRGQTPGAQEEQTADGTKQPTAQQKPVPIINAAPSPKQTTPAHEPTPEPAQDVVDDDGGKVAQN